MHLAHKLHGNKTIPASVSSVKTILFKGLGVFLDWNIFRIICLSGEQSEIWELEVKTGGDKIILIDFLLLLPIPPTRLQSFWFLSSCSSPHFALIKTWTNY